MLFFVFIQDDTTLQKHLLCVESSNLHHYIHFREELQANIFRQSESIGAGVLRQKLQSKRYDFAVSIVYNSFRFNINFQVNQLNK